MTLYYYLGVFYTHFYVLCFFVLEKCKKKNKKFKTGLMTSFMLLLDLAWRLD